MKIFNNGIENLAIDMNNDDNCCGVVFKMKDSSTLKFYCAKCSLVTKNYEDFQQHLDTHWLPELKAEHISSQDDCVACKEKSAIIAASSYSICEVDNANLCKNENCVEKIEEFNVKNEVLDISEHLVTETKENVCENNVESIETEIPINDPMELDFNNKTQNDTNNFKIYPCKKCDNFFDKPYRLRVHLKSHSNERKYICSYCGYAFKHVANLNLHLQRHSGEKRHSCVHCSKMFFTRSELMTHERRHTGEKPYICSSCGARFVSSGALLSHSKVHSVIRPHQCEHCDKTFNAYYQLNEHMTVHTKERKYICEICCSKFTRRKSLGVHMKLHANKREYVCNICKKAFNQRPSLTMHLKTKHKVLDAIGNTKKTDNAIAVCGQCQMSFTCASALEMHVTEMHKSITNYMPDNSKLDGSRIIEEIEEELDVV